MRLVEEMTYAETIGGPWGPTTGNPYGTRLCWTVTAATLTGPRIHADLAMPGADWIRLGDDGIRRQDQRLTFTTDDGAVVLLHYDVGLIRDNPGAETFTAVLESWTETGFDDQYMRMVAQFETGDERYRWLNESIFLGEGRLAGDHRIEYHIHRVD